MTMMQFLRVLWARKWLMLVTFSSTVAATIAISVLLPKQYTATSTLVVNSKASDPLTGSVMPAQLMPGYLATQVGIMSSQNVGLKVVDNLKLDHSPVVQQQFNEATHGQGDIREWLAGILIAKLKITPSRESNLIDVSYVANNPEFAAVIANAFVQAYIKTSLDLRTEPAHQTNLWYEGQIKVLRDKLESAQTRLSNYQRKKGIVAVDERLDVENTRLAELSSQLVVAQAQTYDSQSRNHRSGDQLSDVMNNPLIQGLKGNIAQGESRLAQLSEKLGKNHPEYLRAQADLDVLRKKLAHEMSNARTGVNTTMRVSQQREGDLRASLAAQKAKVLALKQQRDEGSVLARDVESAQRAYDMALQRATQTRMESKSDQTDVAVLNPAIPPLKASSPKMLLNVVLAMAGGMLLAMAFALLAELLDRRLRSEEDFVDILGAPVLAFLKSESDTQQRSRLPRMGRLRALLPGQA
ncbi:MAG: chain length determinant protein EpsF [Burkholderiales bacterium]